MSKIKILKSSIIYVLSPAFYKTGGTELLHQYVYILRKNGFNGNIVYSNASKELNINPAFTQYVEQYLGIDDIEDNDSNVLIVPETMTQYVSKFHSIKTVIWWESVDNYLQRASIKYLLKEKRIKMAIRLFFSYFKRIERPVPINKLKTIQYHFVQSRYAFDFVKKHKCHNVYYVSDYINDLYLQNAHHVNNKEDLVCYNPKKGKQFTSRIICKSKNITFVPIENMTNEEVMNLLSRAKVYIDFGNHPGKDRFPREAALMGCCVITGRKGSANYFEDISILEKYKFYDKRRNITKIINQISDCIKNYDIAIKDYDEYVQKILDEKKQFELNIVDTYDLKD